MRIGHSLGCSLGAAQPFKLVCDHWADEMHQDARETRNPQPPLKARPIDTRIPEMVSCAEPWTMEKLASQTALQRHGTRAKVLPTSAWPWLRARRGGTGSPHGGVDIRGHPVPQR